MKFFNIKNLATILLAGSALCLGALSFADEAPVGPDAYASFGTCSTPVIPDLPEKWSANALLTPFQSQALQVARVSATSVDGAESKMVVTTDNVKSKKLKGWYIQGDKSYALSTNSQGQLQCKFLKKTKTPWVAPDSAWLAGKGCSCQGSNTVTGKMSDAWRCPMPVVETKQSIKAGISPPTEYNWYWFVQDANKFPSRIINSRNTNTNALPVMGDFSLVNFTDVTLTTDTLLIAADAACNEKAVSRQPLTVPGVSGVGFVEEENQPQPPTWPNTAFANGALFAVDGSFTNMAIYYDWNNLQEVSKIKSSDGSIQDTRLTKGITYEMSYHDGERMCDGTLVNVGTWRPDWAHHDKCEYKATIAANSPLNPSDVALQAMSCYFGGSSNIQAWYSADEKPVMFYETNAGDLDLIDYYEWMPEAVIPEGVIYPVDSCEGPAVKMKGCTSCHGKDD